MDRRTFLHSSVHSVAGSALFAQAQPFHHLLNFNPDNNHVLVLIFLNGGNDGLNTVVPLSQMSILNSLRPHVFIPENKLLPLSNEPLALHPSLKGLKNLYEDGQLKIIRAVGYETQNYSHFRSTDIWMSGADSAEVIPSGWAGRYLNLTYPNYPAEYPNTQSPHPLALELGFSNSLLFQGPLANMSIVINGERDYYQLVGDETDETPDTFAGKQLAHVKLIRRQSQVYGEVIRDANSQAGSQKPYPDTPLASQLRIVARMIAGGLQTPLYKVELGGFDTHAGQVSSGSTTEGTHADLLRQLDEAIVAFQADLDHLGISDRVTGMTFSEFGRRIVSNASLGTDHGAAGPVFVFGKMVSGGVSGTDYKLDTSMTYEDNLNYQVDFRQLYGSLLEQWLCVSASDTQNALQKNYTNIPIIDSLACSGTAIKENIKASAFRLQVSPNPAHLLTNLEFVAKEPVKIELVATTGQVIHQSNTHSSGRETKIIQLDLSSLVPGHYLVRVSSRSFSETKALIKM